MDGAPVSVPIPHSPQQNPGNVVREGSGETRPVTERTRENRHAGSAKQSMTGADRRDSPAGDEDVTSSREPLPFRPPRAPLPETAEALPAFSDAAGAILDAGLAQIGLRLDPGARTALIDHARLLLAWTEHVNLTAIRDPERVAREHILDSLAAVPILRAGGITRLLDLGSGGGYPGLPLAIALPGASVALVESIAKKARFLETVVAALRLSDRVAVVNARAEDLRPDVRSNLPVEAVCVRAVADLGELAGLAAPLLAPGGWLVAWKRGDVAAEIVATAGAMGAAGFGPPDVRPVGLAGLEDHRLVVATLVRPPAARRGGRAGGRRSAAGPRADAGPRAAAGRRRRHW